MGFEGLQPASFPEVIGDSILQGLIDIPGQMFDWSPDIGSIEKVDGNVVDKVLGVPGGHGIDSAPHVSQQFPVFGPEKLGKASFFSLRAHMSPLFGLPDHNYHNDESKSLNTQDQTCPLYTFGLRFRRFPLLRG